MDTTKSMSLHLSQKMNQSSFELRVEVMMAGSKTIPPKTQDEALMTLEEGVTYIVKELDVGVDRARELVLTVDRNSDGKLSQSELVELKANIKDIKKHLVPLFRQLDAEGSGFVDPKDAVALLRTELEGVAESSITAMVHRFDKDSNNKVDFGEFIDFYSCVKAKKERLAKKFKELDVDSSGDLDAEELVKTLMEECALMEFQARSLVDDFDLNKDGRIDRQEFNDMWTKLFG